MPSGGSAHAHRPWVITSILLALTVMASGMVAYMVGATQRPDRVRSYAFFLLVDLIVYLITDLDRPRRGLVKLSPAPLEEVLAIVSPPR